MSDAENEFQEMELKAQATFFLVPPHLCFIVRADAAS